MWAHTREIGLLFEPNILKGKKLYRGGLQYTNLDNTLMKVFYVYFCVFMDYLYKRCKNVYDTFVNM